VTDKQQALADLGVLDERLYAENVGDFGRVASIRAFIESVPNPAETERRIADAQYETAAFHVKNRERLERENDQLYERLSAEQAARLAAERELAEARAASGRLREEVMAEAGRHAGTEAKLAEARGALRAIGYHADGPDVVEVGEPRWKIARAALSASEQPTLREPSCTCPGTPVGAAYDQQRDADPACRVHGIPGWRGDPPVPSPHVADRDPGAPSPHA
jgi:hypothetical protein